MKYGLFCLFIVLILAVPEQAAGNGGPIEVSNTLGSGNVRLIQQSEITLLSENLTIIPIGDRVDVHAVYTLQNTGSGTTVEYGFPVDVYWNDDLQYYDMTGKAPIVFILDGAMPLPLRTLTSEGADLEGNARSSANAITNWYIADLEFEPGEIKTVSIHSSIVAGYEDFATSKGFLPSYSNRFFRYVLDPASYWGCGNAAEFQAVVDFSWVMSNGGRAENISAPGEWMSDHLYGLSADNFNLSGTDPIEFEYSISDWKIAELIKDHRLPFWQFEECRTSSFLPEQGDNNYEYDNMFDKDLTTAWVEGSPGNGAGEWIEVDLPDGYGLGTIAVVNGYQRSQAAYEANGRAAQIRCTVYLTEGYEDSWIIDLDDLSWEEVVSDPTHGYQVLYDSGLAMEADGFRLEILDVYPGETYNDLCISECIILGNPGGIWSW